MALNEWPFSCAYIWARRRKNWAGVGNTIETAAIGSSSFDAVDHRIGHQLVPPEPSLHPRSKFFLATALSLRLYLGSFPIVKS